jgi:hypothetical protein
MSLIACPCLVYNLQALVLHNEVIQKAVYANVGYILEQEGDSFIVLFHEPCDAAAFALQASTLLYGDTASIAPKHMGVVTSADMGFNHKLQS